MANNVFYSGDQMETRTAGWLPTYLIRRSHDTIRANYQPLNAGEIGHFIEVGETPRSGSKFKTGRTMAILLA
jgi:hypothetical protein